MLRGQSEGERNEEHKTRKKSLRERRKGARDEAISLFVNFLHERDTERERESVGVE